MSEFVLWRVDSGFCDELITPSEEYYWVRVANFL